MLQFSAESGLKIFIGSFFLWSFFLTSTYNATYAFDRPVNTAVLVCILTGAVSILFGRFVPLASGPTASVSKRPEVPLAEQFELSSSRPSSPSPEYGSSRSNSFLYSRFLWTVVLVLVICGARVELFRRITFQNECAPHGYAYAIPFIVSIYDFWRDRRFQPTAEYNVSHRFQKIPVQAAYSTLRRAFYIMTQSRIRGIFAAALVSIGGYTSAFIYAGSHSTYICATVTHGAGVIRGLALLSMLSDTIILIGIVELCRVDAEKLEARKKNVLMSLGAGLLAVGFIWVFIGMFVQNTRSENENQLFLDAEYTRSAFGQAIFVVLCVISAWQMLPSFGALGISILGGYTMIFFSTSSVIFPQQMPYPYISMGTATLPLFTSSAGALLYLLGRIISEDESKTLYRTSFVLQGLIVFFCVTALVFAGSKHQYAHTHPIDILISKGSMEMDKFLAQANTSSTLSDAIAEYQKRYNQHPPPGFDKWFEYATSRSSVVIDDFDGIYKNLLPFRAIPPAELRDMTQKLATNPFNDLGAISIRNGTARVQDGIKPTHAWMVVGAAKMIENFSEHLPDMDLVFNLNDEPRVAIPWGKLRPLKRMAKGFENSLLPDQDVVHDWSSERQEGWGPIEPADLTNTTIFTDGAWRGVFDPYVSEICPPSSRARTRRIWNRRDMCVDCAGPHTMGQFPTSFDLASDICHQPDLAFLHGLLISPASFKVSQDLIPIFSQSALEGFSDILFPSPWNYMDKVKYDPSEEYPDDPFGQKENSLYWVGSTSEGVSRSGEWKGMPRQRFAHMVNNNTNKVSVLLPTSPGLYQYKIMDGDAPSKKLELQTHVHIADPIARCGADCDDQHDELGTISHVDFQSHWSHRYLFDLDGAGFSGRFLPFLQSQSLPFKTGLFRQWFDSRMVSWFHFVPIDIRLHGLWSTLAYFAGIPGSQISDHDSKDGQMWMKSHETQGWWIANQGREWANKALRKEDMEIFFFRLLLEWGRMTDDQRDVLGFTYESHHPKS